MDEKKINNTDEIEIDLQRLINALLSKVRLIVLAAIVCAVATFFGTLFLVTPTYESTAMFYVNNSSLSSLSDAALSSITSSDISASRGLVKTYIVILNTRESLNDVIDYAGVDRTYEELKEMITADAVDSTEIFQVVVTSEDPQEAEKLANAIAYILPNRIKNIIDGTSAKVVESAVVAAQPSAPNYTKSTMIGFAVGLVLAAIIVIINELMDISIHSEEDITQTCKHPMLAAVPDMEAHGKGGYYYGYGNRKKSYIKSSQKDAKPADLVGGGISFAAAEAYKLLRTKLQFSFADEGACRIIGVSSALAGEGKSLSAINLAYSMSQLGKSVLLIDCDMRRPSLFEKLPIQKTPGLSDFLSAQITLDELVQNCGLKNEEDAFRVVSSGRNPPNPMELLSSARMEKMLERLRGSYDYIILDLPPVGEVSDALVMAKLTDGMLLVVRQNYCDRMVLGSAVRQFEFVDAKILGVVFNCTTEDAAGYGNKYYRKYYKKYYRKSYGKYYRRYYGKQNAYYAAADRATRRAAGAKPAENAAEKPSEQPAEQVAELSVDNITDEFKN